MVFALYPTRHNGGQSLQKRVTGAMAAGIIDQLETVEIDVAKNKTARLMLHAGKRRIQLVLHCAAVP